VLSSCEHGDENLIFIKSDNLLINTVSASCNYVYCNVVFSSAEQYRLFSY
jgi:hypothetical protein